MVGVDPERDCLLDPQQKPGEWPVCGCCGHHIYSGEFFWILNRIKEEIVVCSDCKAEMDSSVCTVQDVCYA